MLTEIGWDPWASVFVPLWTAIGARRLYVNAFLASLSSSRVSYFRLPLSSFESKPWYNSIPFPYSYIMVGSTKHLTQLKEGEGSTAWL